MLSTLAVWHRFVGGVDFAPLASHTRFAPTGAAFSNSASVHVGYHATDAERPEVLANVENLDDFRRSPECSE